MSKTGYHIKEYFTISRSQRKALLVLFMFLMLMIAACIALPYLIPPDRRYADGFEEEIAAFESSRISEKQQKRTLTPYPFDPNLLDDSGFLKLGLSEYQTRMIMKYRAVGGKFGRKEDFGKIYSISEDEYDVLEPYIAIAEAEKPPEKTTAPKPEPFPFDPNKAGKADFVKLGLSESQATNIINYRQAGGRFNIKKDFAKIYSVDAGDYRRLEKYILLPASDTVRKAATPEKTEIAKIEINSADTTALKQLPGIGPAFAGRIVKYRDLLGGFYDAAQLLEVYGMDTVRYAGFAQYIEVNPSNIRKMELNSTGFKELLRHPYMEYYIVKSIFDYRDRIGNFDSVGQLRQVDLIYDQLYDKISNYVTVEKNETQ